MSSLIESKHRGLEWDLMSWCGGWGVTMADRSDPEAVLITGVYGSGSVRIELHLLALVAGARDLRKDRPGLGVLGIYESSDALVDEARVIVVEGDAGRLNVVRHDAEPTRW